MSKDNDFLRGGGESAKLIGDFDWSETSMGEIGQWPQSLCTTLSIILRSKFPMFLFWGPDLICFYNDAYRPYMGNSGKHPAIGRPGKECWSEIWDFIKPLIDQVLNGGEASWNENQLLPIYRNGNLEEAYWTFSCSPVNGESGKPCGVFVTCTETTENVQNLKDLERSKNELEFAINAAELGTWDLNPQTYKFTGNSRLKEWFGLDDDEEIDLINATNAVAEFDKVRVSDAMQTALHFSSGGVYHIEYTVINPKTEKKRVILAKGKALFDEYNIPTRFNGTLQDITENKQAEKELLIINERLKTALEEQKELQRQKDDFLGIASHELKTPVTSIKAYTQVLEKILLKKGDAREAGMMKKMDAQLNRLTSLIGDLLDVTKMNSGRLQFNDSEFDFNEMLRFIIEDLQRTTEQHIIASDFEEIGSIYADQERIGQVLTNLLSNAIKYSPKSAEINVRTKLKDAEIVVSVEDHGIGIPKDKLNRVFEQFYRVSGDMQHTFPGLGLGLYISSEIIRREGGRLWVVSTEGKGSTFCFSLPLHKRD